MKQNLAICLMLIGLFGNGLSVIAIGLSLSGD